MTHPKKALTREVPIGPFRVWLQEQAQAVERAIGGWSLRDREGVRHLPLRPNDDDAWWTPIACGLGINLPGSQRQEEINCPVCLERAERLIGNKDGER